MSGEVLFASSGLPVQHYGSTGGLSIPMFIKERPQFVHGDLAKYLAEFVGTFFLVFTVGCNVHTGSIGAAVSIGSILMVMVYSLGPVSGGHLNPAVTLAIGLSGRGKISGENMCCYIIAQLAGGMLAAFHYWLIFNDAFILRPMAGYSHHDAAGVEIIYTMALCYVVLNVATTGNKDQGNCKDAKVPNSFYGLAIGLTVTSAAIAVGPISGCSLNPAVSVGALFAGNLAHGIFPMGMLGLYCLAPLFGACLAALFFYFVQGGLTGQFEYEEPYIHSRPASPCQSRQLSPAPFRPPPAPMQEDRVFRYMGKGDILHIPKDVEQHNIAIGLSWRTAVGTNVDIDAGCAKFTNEGRLIENIYFGEPSGNEDRKQRKSIVVHQGDNLTGKGVGFGFIEDPRLHHQKKLHGAPPPVKDDERIEIRQLAQLMKNQARCTYMFFVINVFSVAGHFGGLEDLTIRIYDQDENQEICRFQKKDMLENTHNGFVMGVLVWRASLDQWVFQIIDEAFDIKEHGTCRDFEKHLRTIVRHMEGYAPDDVLDSARDSSRLGSSRLGSSRLDSSFSGMGSSRQMPRSQRAQTYA